MAKNRMDGQSQAEERMRKRVSLDHDATMRDREQHVVARLCEGYRAGHITLPSRIFPRPR